MFPIIGQLSFLRCSPSFYSDQCSLRTGRREASHLSAATSKSLDCGADAWSGGETNSPVTGTVLKWHIAPGCEGGTCKSGLCSSDVAITGRMVTAHPDHTSVISWHLETGPSQAPERDARTQGQGGTQKSVRRPDGTEREPKRSVHS